MHDNMKSVLANCYSEISEIWLSTARIAREKIALDIKDDREWWEAFTRRCCIRAGYYARLAEQYEPPSDLKGTVVISKQAAAVALDFDRP